MATTHRLKTVGLQIEGLTEFVKNLGQLDADLPKAMKVAFNKAADVVVSQAKRQVPVQSGKARNSIKAASTKNSVRIKGGGARVPYYGWLDFGGRVGKKDSIVRPFYSEGRYIWHSYYQKRDDGTFERELYEAITDVARQAGLDIN